MYKVATIWESHRIHKCVYGSIEFTNVFMDQNCNTIMSLHICSRSKYRTGTKDMKEGFIISMHMTCSYLHRESWKQFNILVLYFVMNYLISAPVISASVSKIRKAIYMHINVG